MNKHLIEQVRRRRPITFTVANTVTSEKVADALSALGASPIMSTAPAEADELVAGAQAAVLNLGTPDESLVKEFAAVAQAANSSDTPLVLDPVACGATNYRRRIANQLLRDYRFAVIRGNAGEIAALIDHQWSGHGIDAGSGDGNLATIAQECARRYHTTVVLSGERDYIANESQVVDNRLSSKWLTINVGSGDILSSVIGALLAAGGDPLAAGLAGCRLVTAAATSASRTSTGLGSWQSSFFDELTRISDDDLLLEGEQDG